MRFPLELVDEILLNVIETKFKKQQDLKELLKFDRARYLLGKMFSTKPQNIDPVVDLTLDLVSNIKYVWFYDHERLENIAYVIFRMRCFETPYISFYFTNSHPEITKLTEDRIKELIKKICPYMS